MRERALKTSSYPVKNQSTSITFKGKTYAICSAGQLEYMRLRTKDQIEFEAYEKHEQLTQEELNRRVEEKMGNCGFATLDHVLGLMTPQERKDWKAMYRFTPF